MADPRPQTRTVERLASLALILEWGLGLRVLAADLVQWYAQCKGTLCVFPDTNIYWALAGAIRDGTPYEVVDWEAVPHFALRTPGYPLWLAACRVVFGDRLIAVRLAQAVLGTLVAWLVYRLASRFTASTPGRRAWSMPLIASALVAVDPYLVVTSALVLSEALYIPLMLVGLWGLAVLWPEDGEGSAKHRGVISLGTGLAWGAAILVRPSCALFLPVVIMAWCLAIGRAGRVSALKCAALLALGTAIVMAPWWVRNARIYGRFVPTAIWMGASLYDGLNPKATGASDMVPFLASPDIWPLDEETQDALLRDRALAFVRRYPGQALQLAVMKCLRYWSPWPNAESIRSPIVAVLCALFTLPKLTLIALGLWARGRCVRVWVLLMGPLLYFCALHMVFASSMRYRIPAEAPALVLAAIGIESIVARRASP